MNPSTLAAAALATLALASGAMAASTASMAFTGTAKGANTRILFGSQTINAFTGQLKHTISNATGLYSTLNGERRTFCIDLAQHVSSNTNTYDIVDIAAETAGISATYASVRASAIASIYNTYGNQAIGTSNTTTNDFAAAFQIAVWELAYDYTGVASSINLAAGITRFQSTNGAALSNGILSAFNTIISSVGSAQVLPGLVALRSASYQDQLVYVPGTLIPSAGSATMAALGGLLMARRRRRA